MTNDDIHSNVNNIKFNIKQDRDTKLVQIEIYRPMDDNNWIMLERIEEKLTVSELKHLADYIYSLIQKGKKNNDLERSKNLGD